MCVGCVCVCVCVSYAVFVLGVCGGVRGMRRIRCVCARVYLCVCVWVCVRARALARIVRFGGAFACCLNGF